MIEKYPLYHFKLEVEVKYLREADGCSYQYWEFISNRPEQTNRPYDLLAMGILFENGVPPEEAEFIEWRVLEKYHAERPPRIVVSGRIPPKGN